MAMQKLNVRFSDETKEKIEVESSLYDVNSSDLARAAMIIGLEWLEQKRDVMNHPVLKEVIEANQLLVK